MAYVDFNDIGKKYENSKSFSVEKFNLKISKGEFIVFVGPSGCGKSTTLRMLAGLEEITTGTLSVDGQIVNDVHPKNRDIAMVFQNYALYPHMTVRANMAFGLKIAKIPKAKINEKISWAANILGLESYLDRKPKDLSGGQRQRVALGRAIVRNPKVFLMDEPLSNLDAKLRVNMRNEITKLHRNLNATTVYVTHDQVEAMTMADRIVVMNDGIIQQVGTPLQIYNNPVNTFVAGFIGSPHMNLIPGKIKDNYAILSNEHQLLIPSGVIKKLKSHQIDNVIFGIRPEHASIEKVKIDNFPNEVLDITIENLERMGNENHVFTTINNDELIFKLSNRMQGDLNDNIKIHIDMNKIQIFDYKTGEVLK